MAASQGKVKILVLPGASLVHWSPLVMRELFHTKSEILSGPFLSKHCHLLLSLHSCGGTAFPRAIPSTNCLQACPLNENTREEKHNLQPSDPLSPCQMSCSSETPVW